MLDADPQDSFCLYAMAQELAKAGDAEGAIRHYDLAIAADPNGPHAFYHKARVLVELDRPADAVQTLERGLTCARRIGDGHSAAEIEVFLDELRT